MATPKNFVKVWGYLALMYPYAFSKDNISQEQIDAMSRGYLDALEDIPDEGLMAAALKHVKQCKFFPTVSELRILASELLGVGWQLEYERETGGGWGNCVLMNKARARLGLVLEDPEEIELIAEHADVREGMR